MPHRVELPAFDKEIYKQRNVIERCFGRLKHFRFISTRYEKHPENFLAFIKLAIIRIQLRYYESMT